MNPELWLVGYGAWPAPRRSASLPEALRSRGVTRLIDVRISPAASDTDPARAYGPRSWNLQKEVGAGLAGLLEPVEIAYEWMVELGNPQRRDPEMAILRAHLAEPSGSWPVHRGLERLARTIREPNQIVAILCACGDWRTCHRTLVARALAERKFDGNLSLRDVKTGAAIPLLPTMPE